MDPSRPSERRHHTARSLSICYAHSTVTMSSPGSFSPLIEDFEVSYVRTIIEDGPLQLTPSKPEGMYHCSVKVSDDIITRAAAPDQNSDLSDMELDDDELPKIQPDGVGNQLRVKITLASVNKIQELDFSEQKRPIAKSKPTTPTTTTTTTTTPTPTPTTTADECYWDESDPKRKWHFEGKAYSRIINGREHFYCQLCESDGNSHHCFKRREMERHLRRMDHLPPELFCKSAKAVCPCAKNRAFTRIDGRKRHIKISIEHARKDAQSRRAYDEAEHWQKHMKLLETTRGR